MPAGEPPQVGRYRLSTPRGKQFNSMVWREAAPLTGAKRDALFLSDADAAALGVAEGKGPVVRAESGATVRARACRTDPQRECADVLARSQRSHRWRPPGRESGVPDYNAVVEVSRE
jgi:hypothetical protein